jgi:RNA polymerase sigma-70 factor (ECF subfamily)
MADPADRFYWSVLVVRCQVGDRAAFGQLVAHFHPRVRAFLHQMTAGRGPVVHADDLAQEVWLDVFRDLPRLTDAGAFVPWLYRIARNRALRSLRRRPEPVTSLHDAGVELADEADDDAAFTAEDAAAVHAALDCLAAEHREVLLLRFLEDMSYDEIAAVAGCPVGTVRSRLHHAKRALSAALADGSMGSERPTGETRR